VLCAFNFASSSWSSPIVASWITSVALSASFGRFEVGTVSPEKLYYGVSNAVVILDQENDARNAPTFLVLEKTSKRLRPVIHINCLEYFQVQITAHVQGVFSRPGTNLVNFRH
jgi:hypothetical protein